MKAVAEKELGFPEALALLEKRQKEGALGYEQQNTLGYLQEFAGIGAKDAAELKKELCGIVSEGQAVALVNAMPRHETEVKAILGFFKEGGKAVTSEQVKEILKTIKKHAAKK